MAEALPAALSWLDAKKHQAAADIAQAMQAPETIGPNIWQAVKDLSSLAGRQEDSGAEQNARNMMMGFGPGALGTVAKLGLRGGPLSRYGSHFSTRGESTYFDPADPNKGMYNLGSLKILDTSVPQEVLPVLRDVAKSPETRSLKAADPDNVRQALAMALQDARKGESPVIDYITAEGSPLRDIARKHGYGGYKVWEADDITNPSTVYAWDVAKIRPHGKVATEEMKKLYDALGPEAETLLQAFSQKNPWR